MPESGSGTVAVDHARFDAVVFDLDGVITDTASTHAKAWKRMFDEYLRARADLEGSEYVAFDIDEDYRVYVDGKPRCDGASAFLGSRGIDLPMGAPDDGPDAPTVCGLARRKNDAFMATLEESGAEAYPTSIAFVEELRRAGFKTAIISASKNCGPVLAAAGATGLFDAQVDGLVAQELRLPGKPAPDVFLEAARRIGVEPSRAVVVEDALAGVEAGRAGGFGLVVGVDRLGQADDLLAHGADVVVQDLAEIGVALDVAAATRDPREVGTTRPIDELPDALAEFDAIASGLAAAPAFFLDYDGTLTPIVERPEDALMPADTRAVIERLVPVAPIAMISGRDVSFVLEQVDVDGALYAGSHGFDIVGPATVQVDTGTKAGFDSFLPVLEEAQDELAAGLAGIAGARIERKKFAVAVHYRQVADEDVARVEHVVDTVLSVHSKLRKSGGKKVFELRPDVEWDKGKAVLFLLEGLAREKEYAPIYIGDDLTDEDAFAAIAGLGVGIVVGEGSRRTAAEYSLSDTLEVARFLERMAEWAEGTG
jgi:alpha,alpha-trehalase